MTRDKHLVWVVDLFLLVDGDSREAFEGLYYVADTTGTIESEQKVAFRGKNGLAG